MRKYKRKNIKIKIQSKHHTMKNFKFDDGLLNFTTLKNYFA